MGVKIPFPEAMEIRVTTAVRAAASRAAPYTPQLTVLAIFLGFLALRIPFRAEYLINWDAVNYALGTNLFSLEHHQPHPPGYIGYIALGRVLNIFTGDANASFTLLSAFSGAAAPAALFLLASHFMSRRYAAVAAVVFGLSPVAWYYSSVALSYSLEMTLALFFLWVGYQARASISPRHLLIATILLVFLGSVRQSGALFLIPLWLYLAWPFRWRCRLQATTVLVAGNLAWLVPLILFSGGPLAYIEASAGLASLAVAPTSVFGGNPWGLLQNVAFVAGGILIGVNVGLIIITLGHCSHAKSLAHLTSQDRNFFLLWLCPALATFLLLHTGQMGYMLLVLPAFFIWAGLSLNAIAYRDRIRQLKLRAKRAGMIMCRPTVVAASLVAVFIVGNVMGFLYIPNMIYAQVSSASEYTDHKLVSEFLHSMPLRKLVPSEVGEGLGQWARQVDVQSNDDHWKQLINLVESFDPDTTAVLTVPYNVGSFRHLSYYCPEYRVYAIGEDLDETFGHLFAAHDGTTDYSVERLEESSDQLDLPGGITHLVVPDKGIINHFAEGTDGVLLELMNGAQALVIRVPDGATLHFVEDGEGDPRIVVEYPSEIQWDDAIRGSKDSTQEGPSGTSVE